MFGAGAGELHRLRNAHAVHNTGDSVCPHARQKLFRGGLFRNGGVHDAVLAYLLRDGAGVYAGDADDAVFLKQLADRHLTAEVARRIAVFAYDHGRAVYARALAVVRGDAVVAQLREGEAYHLPGVAGVCKALGGAGHAGGEHQLAHALSARAEALAFKYGAVGQQQVGHKLFSSREVKCCDQQITNIYALPVVCAGQLLMCNIRRFCL